MSRRQSVAEAALGMFSSRVLGLVRMKVLAHFFGVSALGDIWTAAMRGPNVVQNLLGEQALSAAFIPIYARKLAAGDKEEATRFAGAILSLLLVVLSAVSLVGVLFAGPIVSVLNPGLLRDAAAVQAGDLQIDRFVITVEAVRIMFPAICVLVLSAWCIGILNSHERFFLSYFAPVVWNASIIAAVVWIGLGIGGSSNDEGRRLLLAGCVGALVGSLLQLAVQLPVAVRLLGRLRLTLSLEVDGVRDAMKLFGPALTGRSAAQLSGYIDLAIAGFLRVGSLAAIGWAQSLYLLPVALFGTSIAAVELPALSKDLGKEISSVADRVSVAFRQMIAMTVPTIVVYLGFGHLIVDAIYRGGSFGAMDNWLVYLVLTGYTLGLLATTTSRLLQSVFFALRDTGTPARVAFLRLGVAGAGGYALSFWLDRFTVAKLLGAESGRSLSLGAVGLAFASAIGAWVELAILWRLLRRKVPALDLAWREIFTLLALSLGAAGPAAGLWWLVAPHAPAWLTAPLVLAAYALSYFGLASAFGYPEATAWRSWLPEPKGR